MSFKRWLCFLLLAAPAVFTACSSGSANLPFFNDVPPFELTDQTGQTFRSTAALKGKVWVANFIFTNCYGPCPRMSTQMSKLRDQLPAAELGIQLVSFTIDPKRDTPEVLATYGRRYGADPKLWHLLTGSQADLQRLSKDIFLLGDVDEKLEHSTRFVIIDAESKVRGYYQSDDPKAMEQLLADARALARSNRQ